MEYNFNPNKGDYKYILEEQERKETGAVEPPPDATKQKITSYFWTWIFLRLLRRRNKIKLSFTVFVEYFY